MKEDLSLSVLLFLGMFGLSSGLIFLCCFLFHRHVRHAEIAHLEANLPIRPIRPRGLIRPPTPPPSYDSVVKTRVPLGPTPSTVAISTQKDHTSITLSEVKDNDPPGYQEALRIESQGYM